MRPFLLVGLLGSVLAGGSAVADDGQRFTSGAQRVALIELYTSEGCSSCPPAERWLGELRGASGLWRDFVPVAWHVDYWNRLGWPDRFSTKDFTQRQYALAAAWGSGSVYTPCLVRDGAELRTRGEIPPRERSAPAGELSCEIDAGGRCGVSFSPARGGRGEWDVHVALLGGGFVSKVTAGENRGERLPQEFVVLAVTDQALTGSDAAGWRAAFPLPTPRITAGVRRALAVWVTRRGELRPVQATGGWLK